MKVIKVVIQNKKTMKIQLTLSIDGSEVYRNYEVETLDGMNWREQVESMADTILESQAVDSFAEGKVLTEDQKMAIGQ